MESSSIDRDHYFPYLENRPPLILFMRADMPHHLLILFFLSSPHPSILYLGYFFKPLFHKAFGFSIMKKRDRYYIIFWESLKMGKIIF
jgi:hypothetical protein